MGMGFCFNRCRCARRRERHYSQWLGETFIFEVQLKLVNGGSSHSRRAAFFLTIPVLAFL
jgi:hypothetical protein